MANQKEILDEIKQLKNVLAKIIGSSELPAKEQFSVEAVEKAAKEFQKLSIERGEWVLDEEISKYIKGAPWRCGKFIIDEFGFTNYFKYNRYLYYNKADIIALGIELKNRNVVLSRYMELLNEKDKFQTGIKAARLKATAKTKKKPFNLPKDSKNVTTTPPPRPSADAVRAHLKKLKDEFIEHKLGEYIEIYRGCFAMSKHFHRYKNYMDQGLNRRIYRWKDDFNNANEVLKELTKKKEVFIPIPEKEIIRL